MNKLLGYGVAVVLCMAAAGFGAYLALKPQAAAGPAQMAGAAAIQGTQGLAAVPPDGGAAQGAVSGVAPPSAAASAAPAAPAPAPSKAPEAKKARPVQSATPTGGAIAGGVPAPAPGSETVREDVSAKPDAGGSVSATPPEVVPTAPPVAEPVEPPPPPPPPQKVIDELVVSADSVIGLRIESTVSSEVAKVEDPVEARVTRDVRVGPEVAIPSGSRVLGSVIQAERGGKVKTAARIGVRFHTLVLPDGTRMPMQTEAIYREGKSPGQESAAKMGAASVGGAILGAIIGGGKGAAIGGAVGAAGGTAAVMAGGRNPAVLSSGTLLTVRLNQAVTVLVERQ